MSSFTVYGRKHAIFTHWVEGKPSVFRLGLPFDKTAVNFPCEEIATSALSLAPLKTQKVLRDHARSASERIFLNDKPSLFILQKRILIIFKEESLNLGVE